MKLRQGIIISAVIILVSIIPVSVLAASSQEFFEEKGEVYDEWGVCRTRCSGQEGFFQVFSAAEFRPVIAFESLGERADRAYRAGQQFTEDYPDLHQRAEKVFEFARNKVRYTSDAEQFGFKEFAQNADEVATTISQKGIAYGDCEDYAVLLAVMYKGAGYRSAIVLTTDHAAALVYLPDYRRANMSLSLDDESGWVWAEATGGNNHLGWMPERYMGAQLTACEVTEEAIAVPEPAGKTPAIVTQESVGTRVHIFPFFGVIALMWLLTLFRRRR